jgi:hypothetical protein
MVKIAHDNDASRQVNEAPRSGDRRRRGDKRRQRLQTGGGSAGTASNTACIARCLANPSSISRRNGTVPTRLVLVDAEHDLAEDRQGE